MTGDSAAEVRCKRSTRTRQRLCAFPLARIRPTVERETVDNLIVYLYAGCGYTRRAARPGAARAWAGLGLGIARLSWALRSDFYRKPDPTRI
jgi:hypothetical protein